MKRGFLNIFLLTATAGVCQVIYGAIQLIKNPANYNTTGIMKPIADGGSGSGSFADLHITVEGSFQGIQQ